MLHMQPFICVAEHHHLKHLRELGYSTFENIIDESYDEIENTQERFEVVMGLSEELSGLDLDTWHKMYKDSLQRLIWNRVVLENDLSHRLKKLVERIG